MGTIWDFRNNISTALCLTTYKSLESELDPEVVKKNVVQTSRKVSASV